MADLGNLSFSVTVKNEADKQLEKIRKDILGKLDIDITPKINVDISAQVREQLKEKFDVSLQVEKQSLDKLRSQVQSVIDGASPSGGRKFTASDLRATRASVLLEEHEQKLASLREQTRQKTANANLAEERLIAARTRSAIENERLKYTQERLNSLMDESAKKGITLSNVFLKLGGTIALEELARKIVTVTGEFEFMEQTIKSLVGSESEGIELMGKLREFARISPLEVKDVTKAAQTLLGFNVELAKVPDMIQRIGDVSMGNQDRFNALTLAFAQTTSAARLTGEDLRQYVNAGFNPLQVISEKTGKSMRELKDEMSKGAISLQMVEQAFIDATSAGGKFYQMSERQSQTINGQLAKLKDSLDRTLDSIGRNNKGVITGAISSVATLVENYEKVIHVIEGLITTYGLYRTAVFLATEAEKGYTIAQTLSMQASILLEKSQKALNATILANPYVLTAVALGGLITVMLASIDTTKEAEIANERYNEAVRKNSEEVDKEKKHIDDLLNTLSDENEAQGKRTAAYNELLEKYPEIFSKYKTEKDLIDNITEARQRENAEIEKKARLLSKQQYDDANNRKKELNRLKWLQDNINLNTHGKKPTPEQAEYIRLYRKYEKEIKQAQTWYGSTNAAIEKLSGVADKEFNINVGERRKQQITDFTNAIKNLTPEQAKAQAKRYNDLIRQANASGKKWIGFGGDYVPISLDDAKNVAQQLEEQANKETHTLKEWAEKTAKNTDEARKAAKGVFDDTKQYTKEQAQKIIKDANAALEASEKESKTFKISDKEGDRQNKLLEREQRDAEKLTEIRTKQAVKMERAARDLEFSTRSAEIGAMEEGTLKILAQIELDKEKKLEAIKREYEDLRLKRIEEAKKLWDADTKNRGKNFYQSEAYKEAASDSMYSEAQINNRIQREREVEAEYIRSIRKVNAEETKAMLEYLKNYGSTEQKRLAIKKEYDEKIAREENEWRRKSLEKERDAALSNLNWEAFKELNNWGRIFANLDNISTSTLENMLNKLQEIVPQLRLSEEATKQVYEAMDKMQDKLTERNPFSTILSSIRDANILRGYRNQANKQGDLIANSELSRILNVKLGSRVTKSMLNDEIKALNASLPKAFSAIASSFKALQDVMSPVIDLFDTLGNEDLSNFFSIGNDALGAAANFSNGLSQLSDLFPTGKNGEQNPISQALGAAGPYGAAAAAGLSIVTSLFAMQDAALQEEIEASQTRQKEMENLTKNLEKVLERTLGGVYNTSATEAMVASFDREIRDMSPQMIAKTFGSTTNQIKYKNYITKETLQAVKTAQQTKKYYDAAYASLLAQRDELKHQLEMESEKKDSDMDKMADFRQDIIELEDEINNFARDLADTLYSIDVKSWASDLGDALFETWQKGEDGADAFKRKASEIMSEVAKNIAVTKLIETAMDDVLKAVVSEMKRTKGLLDEQSINVISQEMAELSSTLPESFNALMDGLNEGMKRAGLMDMKELAEDLESNSTNAIGKAITEQDTSLWASYWNAMRADISVIREGQFVHLPAISAAVQRTNVLAETQVTLQQQIAANTLRNADAADKIYDILHASQTGSRRLEVNLYSGY